MRIDDSAKPPERIHSFTPFASPLAQSLILGSMPGEASLRAGRYYAHPQNQFWRIVGQVIGFAADADYADRLRALTASGIALWDVLESCERRGSLDADIVPDSQQANDLVGFFATHPHVERVLFNGAKAEALFRKHVASAIGNRRLQFMRLPSTSPANASIPYAGKLAAWREALRFHEKDPATKRVIAATDRPKR